MRSILDLQRDELRGLVGLFADIDETISTRGKIQPEAFEALWRLHRAGVKVVPVTGRAAGWCDHIARFWPVDAVVGENGGFYFFHDGKKLHRRFLYSEEERAGFRRRLGQVRERIASEVRGCGIASDQLYREYDLAVDFCEDVAPLPRDQVLRIVDIFHEAGARARVSSIHVNGWYGDFDKLSSSLLCARELLGVDLEQNPRAFGFCGDSPNDEPMFAFFPLSFGVANITPFLDLIERKPAFVTTKESGEGFVEVVDRILVARALRD
ncbi:HAD-IIB family hydrolase [bacterium]|nr:HAD-IIB family hydrolase [bacterium]